MFFFLQAHFCFLWRFWIQHHIFPINWKQFCSDSKSDSQAFCLPGTLFSFSVPEGTEKVAGLWLLWVSTQTDTMRKCHQQIHFELAWRWQPRALLKFANVMYNFVGVFSKSSEQSTINFHFYSMGYLKISLITESPQKILKHFQKGFLRVLQPSAFLNSWWRQWARYLKSTTETVQKHFKNFNFLILKKHLIKIKINT